MLNVHVLFSSSSHCGVDDKGRSGLIPGLVATSAITPATRSLAHPGRPARPRLHYAAWAGPMARTGPARRQRGPRQQGRQSLCQLALSAAALAFGNTPETVLTKGSGSRKNAPARQCGMYLACVYLGLPVALVARCFRRAPSAVHHACRTIEDAREDHDFERFISTLESGLRIWVRHYGPAQGEQNHD